MRDLTIFEFVIRLATGVIGGSLIGIERQWRARMAGVRTNALVAAGATLFVLYSEAVGDQTSPTRVASYVVSGIGFLGGGVILREGMSVRGLNTAATLWCSAAIGVLAASGRLDLSLLGAATVIGIHLVLRPASRLFSRAPQSHDETVRVTLHTICDRRDEAHVRALLIQMLGSADPRLAALRIHRTDDTTTLEAALTLEGNPASELEQLITRLSLEPGIRDLHWHVSDREEPAPAEPRPASAPAGVPDTSSPSPTPEAQTVPVTSAEDASVPTRVRLDGAKRARKRKPGGTVRPAEPCSAPAMMSVVTPGAPARAGRPRGAPARAGSSTAVVSKCSWALTNEAS
jgi:putative Mg2+ transporter-C (MgtC) family protein